MRSRLLMLVGMFGCSEYDLQPGVEGLTLGECEGDPVPGTDINQNDECEGVIQVGSFDPIVKWSKDTFSVAPESNQVMMTPIVGPFIDTDGDDDADADDMPVVAFITYYGSVIRVVSGEDGSEILNIVDNNVQGQGGLALADVDEDGWPDLVAATNSGLNVYDHNGGMIWSNSNLYGHIYGTCDNPAISDMDGDGHVEVIVGNAILDGRTGGILGLGDSGIGGIGANVGTTAVAVDLDLDGEQEVVTGNSLYRKDGSTKATNYGPDGYVAVGNFDNDDEGEIVVSGGGQIRLQDTDLTVICETTIPGGDGYYFGGPATVADFDGDGEAEFAAASGSRYTVFENDCSINWQATTMDATSGNTGSSVFDFEGDGVAEAVYGDEQDLWVFSGVDGSVKLQHGDHSNNTWLEYPSIADVDGDGHADIAVANTAYSGIEDSYGVYVVSDANNSWRPGRKIWNQHAYHITNVLDDGSIPTDAEPPWLTYNSFRSGDMTPATGTGAADLIVSIDELCMESCDSGHVFVDVVLGNAGYSVVTSDVLLSLYAVLTNGDEVLAGETTVTTDVPAGETIDSVSIEAEVPADLAKWTVRIGSSIVNECDHANNEDTEEWPGCN